MSDKIAIVRKFHNLLNEGKLDEAHEYLAHDLEAHTHAHIKPDAAPMSKEEVLESHKGIHQELEAKTVITDAKEVDGKVIVVGKSHLKHEISEVPFKAVYEFKGNLIGTVKFETDPNHKVKSFSLD
ncbi:hypothetical protein EV361DRAFT_1029397 [Lentinula raphanica]|uniref:SnoaL-like domain-containing protein n=1 Tax=Lentinula raphanica TaxID=153919 RepID=A0AA38UHH4_9AGAR|nr:hypothetical protein F5880DRAFT_1612977 [Lentinula raphanica]KAJ3841604.1 hypothetical protein F5878DRAFT_722862 [Lentinula raphanica]KAJ3977999.1 hypothetical protein EV361DRAFT_1029397 [Lentinula raphanica]